MIQKIAAYIREYQMINTGDHVIAGVSGGADSLCLLLALLQLRGTFGNTVSVVHVEHGIRGRESLADAEFVRNFCKARSIECHICHYHVPEYAKAHGMGEEEAGRHLRYASFEAEKEKYPGRNVKIAVAHNLNDNAETMLFHLARGTGISGLAGIAPVRGDIIRPLLAVSRNEIEAYLKEMGQEFCIDATNEADKYSRNQIRHKALPALNQINRRFAEHMHQTAADLREIDDYLKRQAQKELAMCCTYQENGAALEKEAFARAEPVLQKEMLHRLLAELSGSSKDITQEHIRQIRALFDKQCGRRVQLPYGMAAARVYGGVEIYQEKIVENGENRKKEWADGGKAQFSYRIVENISNLLPQISKKKYTKCFDYDKIKNGFHVRNRQPGDYLVVNASGDRQKLKKYLVNEKIPAKEREQLLLLADGAHIMWVVGYRISSYYKVNEHTRRILEVTFYGGKEDE